MAAEQVASHAGRRRKQCGVCSDGSCRQCKYRAYHREYNRRGRKAGGGLLSPASREEERIRALLWELTGEEPKPVRHICSRLDCAECQEAAHTRAQRISSTGCRCGHENCDCARWERTYREKFEDRTYYDRNRGIPRHSPFADL